MQDIEAEVLLLLLWLEALLLLLCQSRARGLVSCMTRGGSTRRPALEGNLLLLKTTVLDARRFPPTAPPSVFSTAQRHCVAVSWQSRGPAPSLAHNTTAGCVICPAHGTAFDLATGAVKGEVSSCKQLPSPPPPRWLSALQCQR